MYFSNYIFHQFIHLAGLIEGKAITIIQRNQNPEIEGVSFDKEAVFTIAEQTINHSRTEFPNSTFHPPPNILSSPRESTSPTSSLCLITARTRVQSPSTPRTSRDPIPAPTKPMRARTVESPLFFFFSLMVSYPYSPPPILPSTTHPPFIVPFRSRLPLLLFRGVPAFPWGGFLAQALRMGVWVFFYRRDGGGGGNW